MARDDTRRKPATRASCIQKRILNDRQHPCRKPSEGEVQSIKYPNLHRIRRLRENLRLSTISRSTDLASRTGYRRCVHRTPEGNLHQQFADSPTKKAIKSTPGKEYDREIPYRPNRLRQHSKPYSDD